MREEVERLEDDADAASNAVDVDAARRDLVAVHEDAAAVDRLEQIDAAQQCRLARTRGADQADDVVLGDVQVDSAEHLHLAERLVDVLEAERAHIAIAPVWWRRRSRSIR